MRRFRAEILDFRIFSGARGRRSAQKNNAAQQKKTRAQQKRTRAQQKQKITSVTAECENDKNQRQRNKKQRIRCVAEGLDFGYSPKLFMTWAT